MTLLRDTYKMGKFYFLTDNLVCIGFQLCVLSNLFKSINNYKFIEQTFKNGELLDLTSVVVLLLMQILMEMK